MPLLEILTDVAKEKGATGSASDRAVRIKDINAAALEIHKSTDLPEALDEEVYDINVGTQQVALPGYVDKIRGHRYYAGREPVDIDDHRNRYNASNIAENELWYLQWRKKRTSGLQRLIDNQSILKFSIPLANGAAFSITTNGQTDKAYKIAETVDFSDTDTEKVTAGNWKDVESFVKSATTLYDITVKDVEDNVVATIVNSEFITTYVIWQIADTEGFQLPPDVSGVEVNFKRKFQPFKNDTDTFFGTDAYDKAIFWKYMEHISRSADDALAFQTKCKQVLTQMMSDEEISVRRKINFKPVCYFELPYCQTDGRPDFR